MTTTETETETEDAIPRKQIDRYRKYQAMAENAAASLAERAMSQKMMQKLEAQYPSIVRVVERIERQEQTRAARQGRAWRPPQPTQEEIEEMLPEALRKVFDRIGLGKMVTNGLQNAMSWAVRQIEEAIDEGVYDSYLFGDDYIEEVLMPRLSLDEAIDGEIEINLDEDEGEDEDGNVIPLFVIELAIPEDLWRRIADSKGGPAKLVAFIDRAILGDDADDADDD